MTGEVKLLPCEDAGLVLAAAAIVDIWMGGDTTWQDRLHDTDFLESADWLSAMQQARAAIAAWNTRPTLVTGQLQDGGGEPNSALAGADDWEVGPCVDRLGNVTSWDINVRPQLGDRGVAVIASVYSGEVVARAILAAIQTAAVAARRATLTRMVQMDEELGLYDDELATESETPPPGLTDDVVKELVEALSECQDKLWVIHFSLKDKAEREAAIRACNMATDALAKARTGVTLNG